MPPLIWVHTVLWMLILIACSVMLVGSIVMLLVPTVSVIFYVASRLLLPRLTLRTTTDRSSTMTT
ncbi:MAG TPA: hypothetical protein VHT21_16530 [Stellaceae bacterium]|nr:hypothetical protein [Stellaceae bacterium]